MLRLMFRLCVVVGVLAMAAPTRAERQAMKHDDLKPDPATALPTIPSESESAVQRDARMSWFREAKFGLFLHWGLYSVPAGTYHEKHTYGEWIMNSAHIPVAEYKDYARQFNPVKYDPAPGCGWPKRPGCATS